MESLPTRPYMWFFLFSLCKFTKLWQNNCKKKNYFPYRCGLIYMCLIPATLRLIHPDLRDLKHRMQELLEDDDSMV